MKKYIFIFFLFNVLINTCPLYSLEGVYLNLAELEACKHQQAGIVPTVEDIATLAVLKQRLGASRTQEVITKLFWHQIIPVVGLRLPKTELSYPFMPHAFSLWQWAPKQGAGAIMVTIDTGLAGFITPSSLYKKNIDLFHPLLAQHSTFNLVETERLPLVKVTALPSMFIAGHGSHSYGLMAGACTGDCSVAPVEDIGVVGLAPKATVIMLKAFKDDGTTNKQILIEALRKARQEYKANIVNLSLKITDDLDLASLESQDLEKAIKDIPYVIAASGNNGNPHDKNYAGKKESYPARFSSVPFDIGSFGYVGENYSISFFSQYEPNIGPKFVAPGNDIISSGLIPSQQENSMYVFMDGTSMAASLIAGFVALLTAEFGQEFSRVELLKACYFGTVQLQATEDWQTKVLLGAIDMRLVLCMLHVMRACKKNSILQFLPYDILLQCIKKILYWQPEKYGKKYLGGVSFEHDMMRYIQKSQMIGIPINEKHAIPSTIHDVIQYVIKILVAAVKKTPQDRLILEVHSILEKKPKLFENVSITTQKRISMVFQQE